MKSPLILAVDDTAVNLTILEGILAKEGFRTALAPDGATGRRIAREARPDVILLDIMMPGQSRFETCMHLKADRDTSDIPVIFISALDDAKSKVRGLTQGAVDYVTKPFNADEVIARIRVQLRMREAMRRLVEEQRTRLRELGEAQRAVLVQPADVPDAAFGVAYRPLEDAGGDYYDVASIGMGLFGYFVADVAGHGVGASFLTAALKALFHQYSGPAYSADETLRAMNAVLASTLAPEQYLTVCHARVNRNRGLLTVALAGHPPPLLLRASGERIVLEGPSDPLGMYSSLVLHTVEHRVGPGDRLFLYTDGVTDAASTEDRRQRLALLSEECGRTAPIAETVAAALEGCRPSSEPQADDLLLMGIELQPSQGNSR